MDVQIPCVCPGDELRHPDGDTVTLKDSLGWDDVRACKLAMAHASGDNEPDVVVRRLAALSKEFMFVGVQSWTLMNGKAIPVTSAAIAEYIISDIAAANVVSEAAEELYTTAVFDPLALRASKSSPPTPITASTSRRKASTRSRPKPSSPSSTTTTRTAGTVTITSPPDGDSNTSRSSA